MKYIKNNWLILILVLLTVAGEVGHLPFKDVPFENDHRVNLDAPIYYFVNQLGSVKFIPSIAFFALMPKGKIHSRMLAFGLIVWNTKEMIDEVSYIKGIQTVWFGIDGSFYGQLIMMLTIIILSMISFRNLKARYTWLFLWLSFFIFTTIY